MKSRLATRVMSAVTLVVLAALSPGATADSGNKIIQGDSVVVNGAPISAWARVNGRGKVIWVGLTFPLSLAENMPAPGTGPARAIAALNYPPIVQATTYFNHVQVQSNEHGHGTNPTFLDSTRYSAPHFDFHYNGIPIAQSFAIPPGLFFAPVPPERLPAGHAQPEPASVPQMGRHALQLSEFTAPPPWELTMIAGFLPDASYMHFIEPMITREFLLCRENFTLPVPIPAVLGRATQYPTEFVAQYDREIDAYHFIFKGFEPIR